MGNEENTNWCQSVAGIVIKDNKVYWQGILTVPVKEN
jgi:hypothetical protein